MTWSRFDDKRHANPKLVAICARDPMRGLAANGLDANAITYCAQNETDGFVAAGALPVLAPGMSRRQRDALVTLLLEVHRWSRDDERGGYWVHDFLGFNESRAQAEERRRREREKKERQRIKGAAAVGRNGDGRFVSPRDNEGDTPGESPAIPTRPDPTRVVDAGECLSSSYRLPPDDDDGGSPITPEVDRACRLVASERLTKRITELGPVGDPDAWAGEAALRAQGAVLGALEVLGGDAGADELASWVLAREPVTQRREVG